MPNVTIQIVPFSVGAHPAMESSFDILDLGTVAPSLVYVEGLAGNMYLERAQDLERYEKAFGYCGSSPGSAGVTRTHY